jgi:excisionase family DNA binding protein
MASAVLKDESAKTRTGLARIGEACEFLAVSRAHLYVLMDNGSLKYVKIGSARRIPWAALTALADCGTAAG